MITHYIIQAIFVLVGLLTLLASLFNWDWFFTARNTQFIVANTTGMPDDCHGRVFLPVATGNRRMNMTLSSIEM